MERSGSKINKETSKKIKVDNRVNRVQETGNRVKINRFYNTGMIGYRYMIDNEV